MGGGSFLYMDNKVEEHILSKDFVKEKIYGLGKVLARFLQYLAPCDLWPTCVIFYDSEKKLHTAYFPLPDGIKRISL